MYYKHKEWARQYPEAQTDEGNSINSTLNQFI